MVIRHLDIFEEGKFSFEEDSSQFLTRRIIVEGGTMTISHSSHSYFFKEERLIPNF